MNTSKTFKKSPAVRAIIRASRKVSATTRESVLLHLEHNNLPAARAAVVYRRPVEWPSLF